MKKLLAIIFSLAILAGCSGNSGGGEISDNVTSETTVTTTFSETETEKVSEATTTTAATSETASETTSVTTAFVMEEKTPINVELCINTDGTLTEFFTERITKLAEQNKPDYGLVYPALWDFDGDGVPEIILTHHNSGQGLMPSYVYSAVTLEEIGEFKGFCRDGFTRFINTDGGTVIYNYYEHSIQIRSESLETVKIKDGRLVSESETVREWVLSNIPPTLKFSEEYSNTEEPSYSVMTADCYQGNVCTSYSHNAYGDAESLSENAVESYNNYIRSRALLKNDIDRLLICGSKNQYAFFQTEEGCFFIDENGEKTLLKEGWAYFDLYTLWDSMIVCQPLGSYQPCDVYIITDGKPVLDEKLSGHGIYFDYSHFYNDGYELMESVYDGLVDKNGTPMGTHTFKKYTFYPTIDGFREYGSIVVPMDEFMEIYGDDIKPIADKLAEEDTEINEVLYRGDRCFILNCRRTIFLDEKKTQPAGAYYTTNITLKPLYDGGFYELCRDDGVYRTALIPEIAVYPEKMYIPEEN